MIHFLIISIINTCLGTKRNSTQFDFKTHNCEELVNIPSSSFTSDRSIDSNEFYIEEPPTKLGKQEDFANTFKEILSYLDTYEFTDLQNEKCENFDDIQNTCDNNQILTSEQLDEFVNEIVENNQTNYVEKAKFYEQDTKKSNGLDSFLPSTENIIINTPCCSIKNQPNDQLYLAGDKIFVESTGETFKMFLRNYILDNIPYTFNENFLRRVVIINDACFAFDKFQVTSKSKFLIFNKSHEDELLNRLFNVLSTFDKSAVFNKDVCDKFISKYDLELLQIFIYLDIRLNSVTLSDEQKLAFFYFEFVKLYKYVQIIPEILTIGGLFSVRSFMELIIIIHSINLFIEKIEDVKENRVFILCMIFKAFRCFYGKQFNICRIPSYELQCSKGLHKLNFFLWEYNANKRRDLKRRQQLPTKYKPCDRKYLLTVILLFLYQHTLFIKYHNVDNEYLITFQSFVNKVMKSDECVGCLFNEFLTEIIK